MRLCAPIAAISPPLIAFLSQRAFLGGDATGEGARVKSFSRANSRLFCFHHTHLRQRVAGGMGLAPRIGRNRINVSAK
jgi:hypothetical protein